MSVPFDLARTLAVVVDEGTMDAAARRLHVTASAVSQRIRALEEQLGRVVLVRTKPVQTTPAGDAVLRLARQLDLVEHDAMAALGDDAETTTTVALAVNADSLATWFLAPLARLGARHDVVFELHRDDQDYTAQLLESGRVMAAVTSRADPVPGCRVRPLGVLRYEAVAARSYMARWMPHGATPDALAVAPVVDFDRRDDLQAQWLRARGVVHTGGRRHFVPASHDYAAAIELGLGWGLLPRLQSERSLATGDLVRLDGPPVDVPLYWQQWNLTSPLLDDIASEVVTEGRRVFAA